MCVRRGQSEIHSVILIEHFFLCYLVKCTTLYQHIVAWFYIQCTTNILGMEINVCPFSMKEELQDEFVQSMLHWKLRLSPIFQIMNEGKQMVL